MRYSPSRELGTCMLCHSIYLQVIKVHGFKLFDKPGLLCSLVSDYRWITTLFCSSFRKPKRFRSFCPLGIPVNIVLKNWNRKTSRTIRFFCKDLHKTLKYVDSSQSKKTTTIWRNSKRTLSLSLSLSLSLLVDPPMQCLLWCACTSLSLSLSLSTCKHGFDPDQTRMVFWIECFVNLKMCACDRKYAKR